LKRILIVKVTSLGDVVQAQPIVADLHRAFPGVKVDWAVDSAFADVPRWNPGVDRVLHAPLRRFKRGRNSTDLRAIFSSIVELRREKYDAVIDIHGVYKSAIISFLARSRRRYGYPNNALGERGAAFAYTHRLDGEPGDTAWQGMRTAVSRALGYTVDETPRFEWREPDAADIEAASASRRVLLFHGTSSADKHWPLDRWIALGRELASRGYKIELPWGAAHEQQVAIDISNGVPGARVLPPMSIEECAQRIRTAALVVGVDTGLVHLAYALGRPAIMIFTATSRRHFGIDVPGRVVSVGDESRSPSVGEVMTQVEFVSASLPVAQMWLPIEQPAHAQPITAHVA
jgi:heptosyltransferase-1